MNEELFSEANISTKLNLSQDELFGELGKELSGQQGLSVPLRDLKERGHRWFDQQRDTLQKSICSSAQVKSFACQENQLVALVVEVANLLIGLAIPVSPLTVAVLLTKMGLKSFCEVYWDHPAN